MSKQAEIVKKKWRAFTDEGHFVYCENGDIFGVAHNLPVSISSDNDSEFGSIWVKVIPTPDEELEGEAAN